MLSQYQVLNKVLQDHDYSIISANGLTSDYFFNYKAEFDFIKAHYQKYGAVPDKTTFKAAFEHFKFVDVNEPKQFLLEQLCKDYQLGYLGKGFNEIKPIIESGNNEAAMAKFKELFNNFHNSTIVSYTDITEDTSRFDRYKNKVDNPVQAYLSTGLFELDQMIGGIDLHDENMVIAARTGIGKTWVLLKMATAACAAGKNVGVYSGEMSTDKVGYRFDTLLGNINNTDITRGNGASENAYKDYIERLKKDPTVGKFNVMTPSDIGDNATVDQLRNFIESAHLDILFVDQYSLLKDDSNSTKNNERVANISKEIKKLQVLTGIPIISVTQNNRTGDKDEKGKVMQDTTQIAESDRIGQDATTIIMLDKEQMMDDLGNKTGLHRLTLNVIKARDGGEGKLDYAVNLNTGRFDYIPNDHDAVGSDVVALREEFDDGNPF